MEFDAYEQEILDAYDRGGLVSVATPESLSALREAAFATSRSDQRVNVRVSDRDLSGIKALALRQGLPHEALIASVIHKYSTGQLVEI